MTGIAIVAALDRELAPLVHNWQSNTFSCGGRYFRVHERDELVAVAGGIGRTAATTVAGAMVERYRPEMLISAGLAGALVQGLQAGSVFSPHMVIDSSSGTQYRSESGNGILVTVDEIVDSASKQALRAKFKAAAVDMEAAAIAEVARRERIRFRCIKAISDESDFEMPPLRQFVDAQGKFREARFVLWAMSRPLRWPSLIPLAGNARRAARALGDSLRELSSKTLEPCCGAIADKSAKVLDV